MKPTETSSRSGRLFRLARTSPERLATNAAHKFALEHAMHIYQSAALYSFIPKNACSTMRFSIAVANGFIAPSDGPNWIHNNNGSFQHDNASAMRSPYAFVILRCPFARLASVYLNKIADLNPISWELCKKTNHVHRPRDLSFRLFLRLLHKNNQLRLNEHWRPQVDFLLFETYDDYFCLEDFRKLQEKLQARIGLELHDTRSALQHHTSQHEEINDPTAPNFTALECLNLKVSGSKPSVLSLFDDECIGICRNLYAEDLALYGRLFGKSLLMTKFMG